MFFKFASILLLSVTTLAEDNFRPCSEISRELRFPCRCSLGPIESALEGNPAISMDCDRVVFSTDSTNAIPYGAPIVSFQQRYAGYQSLPTNLLALSGLPLRSIDFSGNSLRRVTEKLLLKLQNSLVELRLADNLLGDTLNPIFSTSEFHTLKHLQIIDFSGNGIKAIEEGIFEGCQNLQEIYLDRNSFSLTPGGSLNGPKSLKILSLKDNRISFIKSNTFRAQKDLEIIDFNRNLISNIEGGAFFGLEKLQQLRLGHNRLSKFNSDVFQGAENARHLDLSENFIAEFPSVALKPLVNLLYLNLSSNSIQNLDNNDLATFVNLYFLDLSRNNIGNIVPGTFLGLKQLRKLDISVNSLRTIEDDSFEGLDNLEYLNLKDNNILLIPASALGRLPRLSILQLDYNRIAALSGEILRSIAEKVTTLIISRNVVRELPSSTFQYFEQLENLDLTRNLLTSLNSETFNGLETTLVNLVLSQNKITNLNENLSLNQLEKLDLSENLITNISSDYFKELANLRRLDLSGNVNLRSFPITILHPLLNLEIIDLSRVKMKSLSSDFFNKNLKLKEIYLKDNELIEISERSFENMINLTILDLSINKIQNIRQSAFVNLMNIKELILKHNQLSSFKGEFFNTGTSLELIDISNNQLSYLYPSSFRIHPRLKTLKANNNKFNFFPAELIMELQFLEFIDLSKNYLKAIDELDFARLPRLRSLILNNNQIENINEMSFHNSSQLQVVDLSYNKLERFGERTFEGLIRLESLNLEGNFLNDLPEFAFERARLQMLENINLAKNLFEIAPLRSLQKQFFFLTKVDLSRNKIVDIPGDNSIMVNIKNLDLSFNPLSEDAISNVLSEPKTIRHLNLAGTNIKKLSQLETPFLTSLNLSFNNISEIPIKVFERATLLEKLDLSNNQIKETSHFPKLWENLLNLQSLNISDNPIETISHQDFQGLENLKTLKISNLPELTRLEKNSFKSTPNLIHLDAFNYPKLGYLDLQGLLLNLPSLEKVNIETKDSGITGEQLQNILNSRLNELGLFGPRLKTLSSGTFSGLKASEITIRLKNTSISTLPQTLFFPVPRSSHISLDLTGSQLTTLNLNLLNTLDDRALMIFGLDTNPILCDCNSKALKRWLPSGFDVKCGNPERLRDMFLIDVDENELICDSKKLTTISTSSVNLKSVTKSVQKTTEPDIIWSVATEKAKTTNKNVNNNNNNKIQTSPSTVNNDDTLIIGIVGGVVAFIAILVIIICIVRLKMTNSYNNSPVLPPIPGSSCACSVKGAPIYAVPPNYTAGYSATLPHKVQLSGSPIRTTYSTMGRGVPYHQTVQPYFIAYPSEEKIYR
nr:protein artichoke isoform X2 [Onthophagus taurus]XP_022919706.1 protein artichoke isoform X2 [Onthophagus taurus]